MNRKYILPLFAILSAVSLNACASKQPSVNETEKVTETGAPKMIKAESERETEPETLDLTGESALKEALRERLSGFVGIKGSSGASIKRLHLAVRMLHLAAEGEYTLGIISPVVLEYYCSLKETERAEFLDNWAGVDYYTDTILYDFNSISNMLEDAGDLDAAKKLAGSPDLKEKWEIMRKGIEEGLRDAAAAAETVAESETAVETDEFGNVLTGETGESESEEIFATGLEHPETSEEEDETESSSAFESVTIPETTAKATTAPTPTAKADETKESPTVQQTLGFPTGGPSSEGFTNIVLLSVDQKLDPGELNYLREKYSLRLIYDYPNFNMYAVAFTGASNQAELEVLMSNISKENHITSVAQDKTSQLH